MRPGQQGLVQETLASDDIPAVVGVAAALVVAARRLIISVIILYKPGSLFRKRVNDTTRTLVGACCIILRALCGQGFALFHALCRRILAGKIAFHVHLAHIVHGRCHSGLDARIQRRSVDGHAAKTADTDNADALRVHPLAVGQEVHGGKEIFRVDVRRCHPAGLSPALPGKGWIKGEGHKATLCHMLGIQAAALFLHGAEGAAHRNGGKPVILSAGEGSRHIHIGRQLNAVAVVESDLAVVHQFRFRKGLVPFLREIQCAHILVFI